jgi:pyruvate dehydrogenase E2 component (dihydrolipoamide acetyltransferase)
MTYDADTDGVLIEIVAQEGDTLEIGEVIARIGDAGEAKSDGGGKAEEGGEEEAEEEGAEDEAEAGDEEGGEEEGAEDEEEAAVAEGEGDEAKAEEDEGGEEEGDEAKAEEAEGKAEADEDAEEEGGEDAAAAEGEGDEAKAEEDEGDEAKGEEDEGDEAKGEEAKADSEEAEGEDEGDEEAAAAEGEEAAVAGAEGGGGETQAGAGTATREKTSDGNGDGRVKASPVARRMARDLGVELAQLEGTGPGGRIVKADVQAAAENGGAATKEAPEKGEAEVADEAGDGAKEKDGKPAKDEKAEKKDKKGKKAEKAKDEKAKDEKAEKKDEEKPAKKEPQKAEAGPKGDVEIEELTRLQQTVSRRMAESKATAPDFSIALTVDMTAAVELRTRLKEISDPVPSFNDMVVKASANALREHPRVNGAYRDGKFELYDRVNVGIAVAAMDALVVPTIFDADKKSLGTIARDARAIIGKVKDKTVTPPELSGGTFTVSNLGMFGIEQFTAIINPPQAAILTVGKLEKQPAVDDKGKVIARDQMVLTLVCDHRILYGADGAQFLARVKELLEQPLSLAL